MSTGGAGKWPWSWGADPASTGEGGRELARISATQQCAWRCVWVAAPATLTWVWLGQIRFGPYSYDWIDNRGRRSPDHLQDARPLRVGDDVIVGRVVDVHGTDTCRVAEIRPGDTARRLFDLRSMVYGADVADQNTTWLWGIVALPRRRSVAQRLGHEALAWGDLVMMRRQLLTLKHLAQRDARTWAGAHGWTSPP
jgi:hypothetical protein